MTYQFITDHPASLTLAPGQALPRRQADLHIQRRYRQFPVFGADSRVTLIATFGGAIGLRGAIVDNRVDYAFHDDPAPRASGP